MCWRAGGRTANACAGPSAIAPRRRVRDWCRAAIRSIRFTRRAPTSPEQPRSGTRESSVQVKTELSRVPLRGCVYDLFMKVKQQPEDFQVEELTDVAPTGHGPFALYRLEKRSWSTPDALSAIRRR